jgi:hypothetical protein
MSKSYPHPQIADVGYHFDIRIQLLDIRGHPMDVRKIQQLSALA